MGENPQPLNFLAPNLIPQLILRLLVFHLKSGVGKENQAAMGSQAFFATASPQIPSIPHNHVYAV